MEEGKGFKPASLHVGRGWAVSGGWGFTGADVSRLVSSVSKSRAARRKVVPVALPVPTPTTVVDDFQPKSGYFGETQYYVVSVHSEPVQDGRMVFRPLGNCPNFMIVNLTTPVEDTIGLREKLAKVHGVNGIDGVEMHWYTVVIHRPCLPLREPFPSGVHQPWPWEKVWKNVAPVLEAYFTPQK